MKTGFDAVYVRKSTSPQEEQSQIDTLEDYLRRHSITVPKEFWFADTGSRHRPEDRPDFQRMLKLIEEGKISRVFVWKQDRIVSGVKLWGHITWLFERAGTQLIDILTGKDLAADDIATEITTVVNARGAKEEQIKISNNALRAKVSLAKAGMPISKIPPYGYDKKYLDGAGSHLRTVHVLTASRKRGGTRYLTLMPDGGRYEMDAPFRKNKSDRIVYVPTEVAPDRIDAIRFAFQTFAAESITVAKLTVRMNRLGFTIYGKPWLKMTLEGVLRNPAYAGDVRLNNVSRGEFTVYDGEKLIAATNPDRKIVRNPADRQILTPDRHTPLIDRQTWNLVQEKLNTRRRRSAPPKRDDLWLRGLLVCGGCGKPMHTWCQGKTTQGYICGSYSRFQQTRSPQDDTGCGRNWVSHEDAERHVQSRLNEIGVETANPLGIAGFNGVIDNLFGAKVELQAAIKLAVHDYLTELNEVFDTGEAGQEFARLFAEAAKAQRPIQDAELAREIERMVEGVFTPEQARELFVFFEDAKVKLSGEKAAVLKEEFARWVLLKARSDSDRELEVIRSKCRELEKELDVWERRTRPIDERVSELRTGLEERRRRVSEASRDLKGGSNRRKAEVARGLFTRVVLKFRREARTKQFRTSVLWDQTEFEVTSMDVTSRRNCRHSRGPAPTGTRPHPGSRRRSRPRESSPSACLPAGDSNCQ